MWSVQPSRDKKKSLLIVVFFLIAMFLGYYFWGHDVFVDKNKLPLPNVRVKLVLQNSALLNREVHSIQLESREEKPFLVKEVYANNDSCLILNDPHPLPVYLTTSQSISLFFVDPKNGPCFVIRNVRIVTDKGWFLVDFSPS